MKESKEKNIFVFGDSNVLGFWDSRGGWPTRLKIYFDDEMIKSSNFPEHGFYNMVFPLGVTDDTTKSVLERFEFETEKRMAWPTTEEIFIFAIGKNDIALLDFEESERNLREIIKRSKRFTKKISFLEVAAIDESKTQPVSWNKKIFIDNERIKKFNTLLASIAKENNVEVIPLFDLWYKSDYKKMLADGIHPNDKGHEFIFEIVKKFLVNNYM